MNCRKLSKPERWILLGVPFLFALGSLLHFAYGISGENPIVGLFAPVNESVWEHSKMALWPVILWWGLYYAFRGRDGEIDENYAFRGRDGEIDENRWFGSALAALTAALAVLPALYYFYTGAFGVELLWVDIAILLAAVLAGQWMGLHIYRYTRGMPAKAALALMLGIALLYMVFTFYPPHLPWFRDSESGGYGIASRSPFTGIQAALSPGVGAARAGDQLSSSIPWYSR